MTRLEQLEKFYEEEPNDPFNQYALALEYIKLDTSKALDILKSLVDHHGDYLPTYYHLGKLYEELEQLSDSLKTFEQGIEKAKQQNNTKALRELQAAYNELSFQ